MITVKRKRKRDMRNPAARYRGVWAAALAALLVGLCAFAFIGRFQAQHRLDDLSNFMAKAIRTDLNQSAQAYDTLTRRSVGTAGDSLNSMKRCMYSAYRMNQLLVAARGDSYSIIDTATYNSFQTIVGEYERLLANGQSTASVRTSLGDYMTAMSSALASRFDSADLLLPQTASKQTPR